MEHKVNKTSLSVIFFKCNKADKARLINSIKDAKIYSRSNCTLVLDKLFGGFGNIKSIDIL